MRTLNRISAGLVITLLTTVAAVTVFAQQSSQQRQAAEALAVELGLPVNDGQAIDFSAVELNDEFFAALERAAEKNPELALPLARMFVGGLSLNGNQPAFAPGEELLTEYLLRGLNAIVDGAGLTGDAAADVAAAIVDALPAAYQSDALAVALSDELSAEAADPELLEPLSLETISYFNYSAPPGVGIGVGAVVEAEDIIEDVQDQDDDDDDAPRPTPTPPDDGDVTPSTNV